MEQVQIILHTLLQKIVLRFSSFGAAPKHLLNLLVACYATLHPALSVHRSVSQSIGRSVGWSVSCLVMFYFFFVLFLLIHFKSIRSFKVK